MYFFYFAVNYIVMYSVGLNFWQLCLELNEKSSIEAGEIIWEIYIFSAHKHYYSSLEDSQLDSLPLY